MSGAVPLLPKFQFSNNGAPMVNGTVTVFLAGTVTPSNTWQDEALTILNTNPIVLDARGEAVIYLDPALSYKFLLKNAGGVAQWTQDDVNGGGTAAGVAAALAGALAAVGTLRSDLAASGGSALVGHLASGIGAAATTVKTNLDQRKTLKDFGGVADGTPTGGTDNFVAIEKAILHSALTGEAIHVQGKYYTSKPLNFNSVTGDSRHNAKFIGAGKPDVFNATGAIFYVAAGAGFACAEIIDSYHCNLIGIGLCGVSGTSLGIVAARGTFNGGPGHHLIRDCVAYVTSTLAMNNAVGSIGLLNVACEETVVDNCDFWAAVPAANVHLNSVNVVDVDGAGLPLNTVHSFVYTSFYATPLVAVSSSNTVFKYTGQGRLIALNYQGPNILLETVADVDLGHTFMQRVPDPAVVTPPQGNYAYGFQSLSTWGVKWRGTIEHCESMALIRGEFSYAEIDCTLGSANTTLAEIVFNEPTAADRPLAHNRITIRGITNKSPAKCIRNTASSSECLFKLTGTTLSTSSTLQLSTADAGFWSMLNIANSTRITLGDKAIDFNKGLMQFETTVAHIATNELCAVYMPDTGATGSFYLSVKADCFTQLIPATQPAGASSIYSCVNEWVGTNSNTGFGPNFNIREVVGLAVNLIPATSNISALVPTQVTTGGAGKCSFVITPTHTGTSIQPKTTRARVTLEAQRVDGQTIVIF